MIKNHYHLFILYIKIEFIKVDKFHLIDRKMNKATFEDFYLLTMISYVA